jgi:hypothetical protein
MSPDSVGQVIAERVFDLVDGGAQREVRVLIGAPTPIPESPDFYCTYQVVGLADATVRYTEGVDGAQAMYLAMEAVGSLLASTHEWRSGRLTWYGEASLGFPMRAQRPQLRLVAGQ